MSRRILLTLRSNNYKHANTNALTSEIARISKKVYEKE